MSQNDQMPPTQPQQNQQPLSLAQSFLLQDPFPLGQQQQYQQQQQPMSQQQSQQASNGLSFDFPSDLMYLVPSVAGGSSANSSDDEFPSNTRNAIMSPEGNAPVADGSNLNNDTSGGSNGQQHQGALVQLQQNLMLMMQQQQEQDFQMRNNGNGGANAPLASSNAAAAPASTEAALDAKGQHFQQQPGKPLNEKGRSGSGILKDALAMEQDSEDMLALYRQLFGSPLDRNDSLSMTTGTTKNNSIQYQQASNNDASGRIDSGSRLFLGGQVEPLFGKPTATGSRLDNVGGPKNDSKGFGGGPVRKIPTSNVVGQQVEAVSGQQNAQMPEMAHSGPATAMLQQQQFLQQIPSFEQEQQQAQQLQQQQQALRLQGAMLQQQQQQQYVPQAPSQPLALLPSDDFNLPSTMLPPSVLISMLPSETSSRTKTVPVKAGKTVVKPRKRKHTKYGATNRDSDDQSEVISPQQIFNEILEKHGYDREFRLKADDSGYDSVPSPLQLASFGTQLVKAVHSGDVALLGRLLDCGLSPNPCNQFRDSLLDLVCKRANLPIFECLLKSGADLQVVDGFGRTPLHHCCWASNFSRRIVQSILERDPIQIFMEDKHGQTPLEYVRPDVSGEWIDFLEEVANKYWPVGSQPPRLLSPKNRRPDGNLIDPPNAASVVLAAMVSSGSVSPEQVATMDDNTRKNFQS